MKKPSDKAILEALEYLWQAELPEHKFPWPNQLKSKPIIRWLLNEGLIDEVHIDNKSIKMTFHQITHAGIMYYTELCEKLEILKNS